MKILAFLATCFAFVLSAGVAVGDPAPQVYPVVTGVQGGGYWKAGTDLANFLKPRLSKDASVAVVTSNGSLANYAALCEGRAVIGFAQGDAVDSAESTSQCSEKPTVLAALGSEAILVISLKNGPVSSFKDLVGKKVTVSCGPSGSGTDVTCRNLARLGGERIKWEIRNEDPLSGLSTLPLGTTQALVVVINPDKASKSDFMTSLVSGLEKKYRMIKPDLGFWSNALTAKLPGSELPLYEEQKVNFGMKKPDCYFSCGVEIETLVVRTVVLGSPSLPPTLRSAVAVWALSQDTSK